MRSTSLNSQPVQVAAPMVTRSSVPVVMWWVLSAIVTSVAGFLLSCEESVFIGPVDFLRLVLVDVVEVGLAEHPGLM